ncbi:N-acetylmuramoyl-L-alanine amidase [Pectinatus frisingensis]|uniref:N-acetylmuramoyl-L-alanine amidase n=1 Tax=Pectinatus frisingensis TaxID=865 RepID=UPI0018C75AA2|nr:N-acetylmuramoyl-L-alanine amidase [Pectinatus frisingensis]
MQQVTLEQVKQMASDARQAIWDLAKQNGREPKIYLHWSAGHYGQFFNDYHLNIDKDGTIYASTDDLSAVLAHTYMRNSGAVGISLACAFGANTSDLGAEPPTPAQIEAMAQVINAVADGLWLTIDKEHVMTHGEAADNEDGLQASDAYGPKSTCERWDLEFLGTKESPVYNPYATDGTRGGDVLRGKANWYRKQEG